MGFVGCCLVEMFVECGVECVVVFDVVLRLSDVEDDDCIVWF